MRAQHAEAAADIAHPGRELMHAGSIAWGVTVAAGDLARHPRIAYAGAVRICFVCLGNICRSPTAEAVMQRLIDDAGLGPRVTLDSAGTGGWHAGDLADPRTRAAAAQRGIAITHRARQFVRADLDRFDLVIAMDRTNLAALRDLLGGRAAPALHLLRAFEAGAPGASTADAPDVPDPYAGGSAGFEHVLDLCDRACRGLVEYVRGHAMLASL
jgi:protein-tyrosine phosphatase